MSFNSGKILIDPVILSPCAEAGRKPGVSKCDLREAEGLTSYPGPLPSPHVSPGPAS